MRNFIVTLSTLTKMLVLCICIYTPKALADNSSDVQTLMQNFFSALKTGATDAIALQLSDPILSERREILTNSSYSSQLQQTYKNALFSIDKIDTLSDNIAIVRVKIRTDDKEQQTVEFTCLKESDGWRISEEKSLN